VECGQDTDDSQSSPIKSRVRSFCATKYVVEAVEVVSAVSICVRESNDIR